LTFGLVIAKLRMYPSQTYKLEFIAPKDYRTHQRRGVAFLISEDTRVTAKQVFDGLKENTQRMFRARFDYWIDGMPYEKGYHRWDKSEYQGKYVNCLVFTCRENRLAQRFYGFLCNPKTSDHGYHLCILIRHASKSKHETDETDLKIVEEMRTLPAVKKAIDDFFKEKP
jgi:hypothetical protein